MNHQIIFTPGDLIEIMKSICYLITLIAAVVGIIVAAVTKAKAPGKVQDEQLADHTRRIEALEKEAKGIDVRLKHGDEHFGILERQIKTYQRGMLALVNHSIDGNNITELEECRDELQKVIWNE